MRRAYGIDWSDDTNAVDIHLACYRKQPEVERLNGVVMGQAYHFANAIRILFPDDILTWHPWLDDHINIWCENRFFTVWGPAASSKSNNFGLFCLVDWFAAPEDTCTFVCSTSKGMLERRIWEAITRYYNYAKTNYNCPGKISKQRTAIINEKDRDLADDVKAGIHGVAVKQGTVEEAQSNLIGAHLPYVRLLIDEMQATRRAAVEARKNLSKGCIDFKFGGIGNPMSYLDLLGEFSEPDHPDGYDSVTINDKQWKTRYGMCYHFDGFESPAIVEPDGLNRFPFLINRPQIDADISECGGLEDHPDIWTMCRGFVPREGVSNTILSRNMIRHGKAMEPAVWEYDTIMVGGLDPAFTSTGDKCVLATAKVGKEVGGRVVVEFQPNLEIPILASDPRPVSEQIADSTIKYCKLYGIKPHHLGVDETGTQSVGDFIEMKGFRGVHRVSFAESASGLPVSKYNPDPCSDEYHDKVAELWFSIRQFVVFSQIRGMDPTAAVEFCERLAIPGIKKKVEKKDDMKIRLNRSPDDADAETICLDVVRSKLEVYAGTDQFDPGIFGFTRRETDSVTEIENPDNSYENDMDPELFAYGEAI